MSPCSSELEATVPVQVEPGISSLMIAIIGYCVAFAFLAVIIGLCLIAIDMCSAPHFPPSSCHSVHSCAHHHHLLPDARRGRALPIASSPRCSKCHKTSVKAGEASRASQASIHLLAPLLPYSTRHGPTGTMRRMQPEPERSTPSSTPSFTTPAMPSSSPLGNGARGPTVSLRPVEW